MKFAYFPGCKIPFYLEEYGLSFEAIMDKLSVELVKLPFNCCGYPSRSQSLEISVLSSIKNLAIAEKNGLDIITPCKCCFGQFKHAAYWWHENSALRSKIRSILEQEGLSWGGETRVRHLLSFLYHDLGLASLKDKMIKEMPDKKVVVQYGCHALRPFSVTGFDNPFAPKIFEELVNLTGITVVPWKKSTECCGNPIFPNHKQLAVTMFHGKLKAASEAGADYICSACTHCQMQYNETEFKEEFEKQGIAPVLFTQVFGTAMGIGPEKLFKPGCAMF
jgi:heterodisulfide reductase subunit B